MKPAAPSALRIILSLVLLWQVQSFTSHGGGVGLGPFGATAGISRTNEQRNDLSCRNDNTQLGALLDPSVLVAAATDNLSPENIHTAFSVATFLPQPFWLLIVFLPNTGFTKKIMGGMEVVTLCALVHFFIVAVSIVAPSGTAPIEEFNGVFDPAGDPQAAFLNMMNYPNFVSEEWSHVLTWDLFVGRWIWLDGRKRDIFTPHSVLLTNLIGPPGLLLHWATCLVTGNGLLPPNEALEDE